MMRSPRNDLPPKSARNRETAGSTAPDALRASGDHDQLRAHSLTQHYVQLSKDHYAQHPDVEHFREGRKGKAARGSRVQNSSHFSNAVHESGDEADENELSTEQQNARSPQTEEPSDEEEDRSDEGYEMSGYANTFLADEVDDEEQRADGLAKGQRSKRRSPQ